MLSKGMQGSVGRLASPPLVTLSPVDGPAIRPTLNLQRPSLLSFCCMQLCAGASAEEAVRWGLPRQDNAALSFATLAQSSCVALPGVDDAHEFRVRGW